jgi:hypothetical protein
MANLEGERPRLFDVADIMERMSSLELRQYKVKMLAEISDRERIVFGINDILEKRSSPEPDSAVPRLWNP